MKVAIYLRESGTRKYKPASPRAMYPANVTFCLRYSTTLLRPLGSSYRSISCAWKPHTLVAADISDLSTTLALIYQAKSQKDAVNGYAGLDSSGLVPHSEIPALPESRITGLTTDLSTLTSAISTETSRAEAAEALLAPLASPALTGTPTAPTASPLTSNTQVATTAYVDAAVTAGGGGGGGGSSTLAGDTDVVISSPANNDVLTYETSSSKWKNKPAAGGGGGGVPAGSNLIPASSRSGTDSGFRGYSIIMRLPQGLLLCLPTSWKFSISLAAGASYVVTKGVVYRTNVDSQRSNRFHDGHLEQFWHADPRSRRNVL